MAAAAGFHLRQLWDDPALEKQQPSTASLMASLPKRAVEAVPKKTSTATLASMQDISYSQRFPSRQELRKKAVGPVDPHIDEHIPGYQGHRPREWSVPHYNLAKLAAASNEPVVKLPRKAAPPDAFKSSKRRFEVTDHLFQREGHIHFDDNPSPQLYSRRHEATKHLPAAEPDLQHYGEVDHSPLPAERTISHYPRPFPQSGTAGTSAPKLGVSGVLHSTMRTYTPGYQGHVPRSLPRQLPALAD
eukprot:TRINITY_DN94808_c0_g1_i1.p1 TRINITY_DN94808_c0_g1~~TRINITY_DN94808_c0_g1_i1.p1  ORF type:complete len:254 (+),score=20.90 TRINITY_DN94808_c0_g1_i1:28-762(+)